MAQHITSKRELARRIDTLYHNPNSAIRQELFQDLSASHTGLWTDAGDAVEGHRGPKLDPEENVQ